MKIFKKIISIIFFFIILIFIMLKMGKFLIPIWNDEWLNTSTVKNFYNLEKNSIDVLALGSSHVIKGFSSLELYNNYGISAYGLGTEQQSLYASYAWIKESLKTQNEKVILLEAHMFFEQTPEPQNRKALDNMKLSLNKLEAISQDSIQRKSFENFTNLIFPILRFHSRWEEILIDKNNEIEIPNYRGYSLSNEICGNKDYTYLDESIKSQKKFFENYEDYLLKIINYCKKKNIGLIIYKSPDMDWDTERYNAVKTIADKTNIPYFDFNTESLGKAIDFNYANDCENLNHTNIYGAQKVTNFLGKFIKENYEIEDKRNNPKYENLKKEANLYNCEVENAKLINTFDPATYIESLKSENFTVVYVKTNLINDGSENYYNMINTLGLDSKKVDLSNYYAIFENGKLLIEEGSNDNLHLEKIINNDKKIIINTQSNSILFNGIERSSFHQGFNIFVFSNPTNHEVESSYINYENGIITMGR